MNGRRRDWNRAVIAVGLAATVLAMLWLAPQLTRAATLTVGTGGTHATIQAAIDAANPGDTIQVRNETFNESLIITKSLTLLGGYEAGFGSRTPRSTTVGNVAARVIDIQGTGIAVTIDGFEIAEGTIVGGNGGGIYVDVEDDSQVTINDNFIHDNSADDGGGIYADVDNRSDLHITSNDVMTNTTSDDYAGIYADVYLSGTLTLTDNDIVNNSGDQYGGLRAYVEGFCQFQIEDNLVMSNTTTVDGASAPPYHRYGGLYFEAQYNSHGAFDRNQVIGNYADDDYGGGYVEMYYNSSTTFYDNEFRNNTANYRYYGGLYLYAYYNSHVTGDNLVLADNTVNGGSYDYGGGYVYAGYNSTVTLPNTRVTGNRAGDDYGGASFKAYAHSTINVPDLYVYDNVAGGSYGGVYLDATDGNDTVIAIDAQVISNTAQSGDGGGGYAYADDGSLVDLTGSLFERNTAGGDGGGLYVSDICEGSKLLLGQTAFLTNTTSSDGGGIYFVDGPNYNAYLELSYARFISNTAQSDYGGGFYIGDVYYNDPTAVSIQADHMTFERNTAGDYGGGFYLDEAYEGTGQLVFDDGVYRDNRAGSSGGGGYWDYCYEGCDLSMSGNLFENNEATTDDGGGFYFYEAYYGSEVHFDDNQFLDNTAGGDGGGFYNSYFAEDGAAGTFDRNTLRGNTAGGDGGGFYSDDFGYAGADVSFSDNVVVDNVSDGDGGGVYMYYPAYEGVTLAFNRNVITGNVAIDGYGGGLYFYEVEYGSRVDFHDNVISQNVISSTSSYDGGGIYIYTIDEGSIVRMTGNEINDNVATDDGGGLYMGDYIDYGSVWIFEDNELQRNWAGEDGGGCYFDDYWYDGSMVHFNRNLVNDNTAIGYYGGCYFYDIEESEIDFIGNQFNRNTAGDDHGGLYFESVYDGSVMRFWDNQIIGNRAGITETVLVDNQVVDAPAQVLGGDYGGLYLGDIEYGSEVDFRRNQVLSNTAYLTGTTGGDYGGMYAYLYGAGLLTMVDNTIAGNKAQEDLGGLYVEVDEGSRLVMEHNLIRANKAVTDSAGVYIEGEDDSQYFLRRNQIVSNSAGGRSAGLYLYNDDATEPLWGVSENNLIADNGGVGIRVEDMDFWSTNDTVADNVDYGIWMTGTVTSTAYLSNTILWGHTGSFTCSQVVTYTDRFTMAATYSNIEGDWPGAGNIDQDPLFVGGDDYHLQQTSPAVDIAETTAAPATDLDGVPRPVPSTGEADMGCYEWRLSGLELAPEQSGVAAPGQAVTYTLTITNAGNAADTFALDVFTDTRGWVETIEPATISLDAGAHATVEVLVSVPAGTAGGLSSPAIVRATSQTDPTVVASVVLDTEAANVADLTLSPDHTVNLVPGLVMRYEHTLTNDGNFTDSVHLTAQSSQGWSTEAQPVVEVPAGGATTVALSVTVPGDAPAGTVDTTVFTVTSATMYGVTTTNVTNIGSVLQFASVSLTPEHGDTASPGTTITYTHAVTNAGNGLDTFSFSTTSSQGWSVSVTPNDATVPAGTSAALQVAVTVPPTVGDAIDVTTVTARSTFNHTVFASIQDTTRTQNNIYLPLVVKNR